MKEFNLSEKRMEKVMMTCPFFWEKDVKEFIKRLKEADESNFVERGQFNKTYFKQFIDKLAGDKLK